jgi:hypothetical protein
MQFFYDGQIRRYLTQIIRLFSNFVVKRGDGTLERIPVMYGDIERQTANIINQNSENNLNSAPRIAVYITDIALDRIRLADPTFIGKVHIRERDIVDGQYGFDQGRNYTVERLMPTPYTLSFKADIWSANTDQKLQIMEQILMLFNPSLEIQTTDNYIDWTSLSVVDLNDIIFSSRTIPVGTETPIDITTLTLQTPIWISPPAKVKKMGVVTNIIANVFGNITEEDPDYIKGLGTDTSSGSQGASDLLFSHRLNVGNFDIAVSGKSVKILNDSSNTVAWTALFQQFPGKYKPGLVKLFLKQSDHTDVVGYCTLNLLNDRLLSVSEWDVDTFPSNDLLPGPGRLESSWGTFDAIIDPTQTGPIAKENRPIGLRYLIIEGIGGGVRDTFTTTSNIQVINTGVKFIDMDDYKIFVNGVEANSEPINREGVLFIKTENVIPNGSTVSYEIYVNEDGPDAWKNGSPLDPTIAENDFIAEANDIIEWDGAKWHVIFSAKESQDVLLYLTNLYTLTQYKWNGRAWVKSVDGEYRRGWWRIEL